MIGAHAGYIVVWPRRRESLLDESRNSPYQPGVPVSHAWREGDVALVATTYRAVCRAPPYTTRSSTILHADAPPLAVIFDRLFGA